MTFATTATIAQDRTRRAPRFLTALWDWLQFCDTGGRRDGLSDHLLRDIGIERGSISETARRSTYSTTAHARSRTR